MADTKIEWADKVWNPVHGCTKVSPGCANCYAERMAKRIAAMGSYGYSKDNPFKVFCNEFVLNHPLNWKKPAKIFVNSMGDLFHEEVPDSFIGKVFEVIACSRQHIFQLLTKRPERMMKFINHYSSDGGPLGNYLHNFPHLWLGVSAENQQTADERIPLLLQTPAAVRFVSVEPLLGVVDLSPWLDPTADCCGGEPEYCQDCKRGRWINNTEVYDEYGRVQLDWVIVGGESGLGARPMHPDWARGLRDQCQSAGVPFLFKQWGEWCPLGREHGGRGSWQGRGAAPKSWKPPTALNWRQDWDGKPTTALEGYGTLVRCGKKNAGRLLDGREWLEYPNASNS